MKTRGFTFFEVILVVLLLAILSVSGLPIFINYAADAKRSTVDGILGSVRDGIAIYRANELSLAITGDFPPVLDSNPTGSPCVSCFSEILANGLTDSKWRKETETTYTANDGTTVKTFVYNPASGTFGEL
jgi:MSHA pilin protein MshA